MFECEIGIPIMYVMTENEDEESNEENSERELTKEIVEEITEEESID